MKGPSVKTGCPKCEYEIPIAEAEEMLCTLYDGPPIEKTRFLVPHTGLVWDIDVHEGALETREGQVREVGFHADGQLEEIGTEVQQTDVPQPVMQALQRWMPNFRPTRIERSDRPAVSGVTYAIYEFEGQYGGVEVDVEAFPDGSRVMIVDDSRN